MLVMLYKIGEVHFRLLGTNGFHAKAENERFTAAGWRCRQKLECRLSDYVKELHQEAFCTCSTIIFLTRPIKSLICGVLVAIAVVIS